MRAMMYDRRDLPDVLQLREVEQPTPAHDQVQNALEASDVARVAAGEAAADQQQLGAGPAWPRFPGPPATTAERPATSADPAAPSP